MAATVTTTGKIAAKHTKTVDGISRLDEFEFLFGDVLNDGTGLDQNDLVYGAKAVALSGSGTNSLDVAGALSDAYGTTITAVKLKIFYFRNLNTTAGNSITLGNDTNELLLWSAGATKIVGPDGVVYYREPSLAGIAVTAATGDILKILNNTANAVTYDIFFSGTSA